MNIVPAKTITGDRLGFRQPARVTGAASPSVKRTPPAAPAREDTVRHRLRLCLGDPVQPETKCHYAHANSRGGHQCKKRCCGALAQSIEQGVTHARISCSLKDPMWGPEQTEDSAPALRQTETAMHLQPQEPNP